MTYPSIIETINDVNIIRIPAKLSDTFPSRGMVMAEGTIDDVAIQVPIEPDGNMGHWFEVDDVLLKSIKKEPGNQVLLSLVSMDEWLEPKIPEDLQEQLALNGLIDTWNSLTVKAHWDWIRWIRGTKNPATRLKRIHVACDKLLKNDRRPCCFNRNSCTVTQVSKTGVLLDS